MAQYYVSKTGNDSNNGSTWALAKLTLAAAITASTAGDTLYLGAGTWTENLAATRRNYIGLGMLKTIISTTSFVAFPVNTTYTDIKIILTGVGSGWNYGCTFTRAFILFNFTSFSGNNVWGDSCTGSYSIFATTPSNDRLGGNYFRNSFQTYTFDHCVFYGCLGSYYFYPELPVTINVTNCIFYVAITAASFYFSFGTSGNSAWTTEQYNCFYAPNITNFYVPNSNVLGTGSIRTDPKFVDPANYDFRLQPTSPCIGTGHA